MHRFSGWGRCLPLCRRKSCSCWTPFILGPSPRCFKRCATSASSGDGAMSFTAALDPSCVMPCSSMLLLFLYFRTGMASAFGPSIASTLIAQRVGSTHLSTVSNCMPHNLHPALLACSWKKRAQRLQSSRTWWQVLRHSCPLQTQQSSWCCCSWWLACGTSWVRCGSTAAAAGLICG